MGHDLNHLWKDEIALKAAHQAFNIHVPDKEQATLDGFREQMKDPETVSLFNAMMHVCKELQRFGYEAK